MDEHERLAMKSKAFRLCEHIAEQAEKDQYLNALHAAGELVTLLVTMLNKELKGAAARREAG